MRFVVLSSCFCNRTRPVRLSLASECKSCGLLLFGRLHTGEDMSFSFSVSRARVSSSIRSPSSLASDCRIHCKVGDEFLEKYVTSRLHTLQSLRTDLNSVTLIGTCSLRIAFFVPFSTSIFPSLIRLPM